MEHGGPRQLRHPGTISNKSIVDSVRTEHFELLALQMVMTSIFSSFRGLNPARARRPRNAHQATSFAFWRHSPPAGTQCLGPGCGRPKTALLQFRLRPGLLLVRPRHRQTPWPLTWDEIVSFMGVSNGLVLGCIGRKWHGGISKNNWSTERPCPASGGRRLPAPHAHTHTYEALTTTSTYEAITFAEKCFSSLFLPLLLVLLFFFISISLYLSIWTRIS